MRRRLLHHQVMSHSSPRHLRRQTLISTAPGDLSEGVLVDTSDETVVEIVGGPPFATLELFAAHHRVGSVTLDQLGSGSAVVTGVVEPDGEASVPVALCHGECTVLEGSLSTGPARGAPRGDGS